MAMGVPFLGDVVVETKNPDRHTTAGATTPPPLQEVEVFDVQAVMPPDGLRNQGGVPYPTGEPVPADAMLLYRRPTLVPSWAWSSGTGDS